MCISAELSFSTWIVSSLIACYIIYRNNKNDIWVGACILIISIMQLIDFLIWISQTNDKLNIISTKIAFLILWLQPLWFIVFSLFSKTRIPSIIQKFLILILSFTFLYACYFINKINEFEDSIWITRPGPNNHLVWNFFNNDNIKKFPKILQFDWRYYIIFAVFLFMIPFWKGCIVAALIIGTFIISLLYSYIEFGSIWCWLITGLSIIWTFIN